MAASETSSKTHVLIFPFPAQGHMIPLLDFTHHLALRCNSTLKITILVTPKNLPLLSTLLSSHPPSLIQPLTFPFPFHPLIPSGVENVKDLPPSAFPAMMHALGQLRSPLSKWLQAHDSPPAAIISDFFLAWTTRLGVPCFTFSPSAAVTCCVLNRLWLDMPRRKDERDENEVVEFPDVPNCPKYPWWQMSPIYRGYVKGDPFWEFVRDVFRAIAAASSGLVVNSFTELERVYLDHLKRQMGHDRVWAVGPALPTSDHGDRGGPTSVLVEEVMMWLDNRSEDQVVYVCFGSQAVLTNDQISALASGLEKSGVHFVWAVKEPTDGGAATRGKIPSGFEDRVSDRGLVIRGWAPQVSILNHRAVGAFLTHCGWNSVMEGVVSGVLMLTWPMGADQFTDAMLIVDQLKIGMRVCEGADAVPDPDELARVLAEAVGENRVERERAKELAAAAAEAVREGGSSVRELDALVEHLVGLEV